MSDKTFFVLEANLFQTIFDFILSGKYDLKLKDCVSIIDVIRKNKPLTEFEIYNSLHDKFNNSEAILNTDDAGNKND